jgi:hypothetical protein
MTGLVTVGSVTTFVKLINIVMPLVVNAAGLKKCPPPPHPRHVFDPYCNEDVHCANLKTESISVR